MPCRVVSCRVVPCRAVPRVAERNVSGTRAESSQGACRCLRAAAANGLAKILNESKDPAVFSYRHVAAAVQFLSQSTSVAVAGIGRGAVETDGSWPDPLRRDSPDWHYWRHPQTRARREDAEPLRDRSTRGVSSIGNKKDQGCKGNRGVNEIQIAQDSKDPNQVG